MIAAKAIAVILILCLMVTQNVCDDCYSVPQLVQLGNGGETGIVSQPSYCRQVVNVVAQNVDQSKNIKIRFTIVPSNFDVQVYDGKYGDARIQNCQIQSGSICYSTGSTVTFSFTPRLNNGGVNNRVELSATPYNNAPLASVSFLTLFFGAFMFLKSFF